MLFPAVSLYKRVQAALSLSFTPIACERRSLRGADSVVKQPRMVSSGIIQSKSCKKDPVCTNTRTRSQSTMTTCVEAMNLGETSRPERGSELQPTLGHARERIIQRDERFVSKVEGSTTLQERVSRVSREFGSLDGCAKIFPHVRITDDEFDHVEMLRTMRKRRVFTHDSIASQLAHGCSAPSVVGPSANLLIRA